MTFRDQMSDSRPYRSWPTVDVLGEIVSHGFGMSTAFPWCEYVHEVAAGYPGDLGGRPQCVADDVQAGRQHGLVHQGQEVDAGAGQEYLHPSDHALRRDSCQAPYRDDSPLGHIVRLLVELVDFALGGRLVRRDTIWRTWRLGRSQDSGRGRRVAVVRVLFHCFWSR